MVCEIERVVAMPTTSLLTHSVVTFLVLNFKVYDN